MKKIISYFLSGIVLCTALLVTPVSAAEVAPAEETITINSTVSVRATNYWTKTTTKLNSVYGTASNISTVSSGSVSGSNPQILKIEVYSRVSSGSDSFYLYVEDGNGNVNYTTVSKTSYGKSSEKLNWDAIVSKKGETRVEHIKRHTVQNNSRETHSVFNGNPIDMVNDAWEQRHLVEPISDGMGGTIYNIPYKNAGYESGYINTGAQMDYITIVTLDESTDLITAFPSFGDYHK